MAPLATPTLETEQQADWASLPPELLALVCRALLADLHAHGPCCLRDASRAMAALSPCSAWRRVALEEAAFSVRLAEWNEEHLASVPIRELALPALLPKDPAASAAAFIKHTGRVLCSAAFRRRSGASLEALHGVPLQAVAAGQLLGWGALRRLSINPDSLPDGGGASVPAFLPGAFPPSLRELDLPVPRYPFRLPGGLPQRLDRLVLRCSGSDFIVGRHVLLGSGEAEAEQAAAAGAAPAEAAAAGTAGTAGEAVPPRWRHLEVHAGRAAVLDLDDLPHLAGVCSSLALHGPLVMVATSDPAHAALLVAPPVRSLDRCVSQYQQVLAPALAAAGISQLVLVASETSFYCKQPGRRVVLDATALPPLGAQQASAGVEGYGARLAWPAAGDGGGPDTLLPTLCLSVARTAS